MERLLVVVFDNELKAYDGSRALDDLDFDGSISVYAEAVVQKNADGKVAVKEEGDDYPIRTVGGTAIGATIGLLGGPIGVGIGALAGTYAGSISDLNRAGVNAEFLDDVSAKLTPGKWAVVADISEEWETPVDTAMAALGGTVFRESRYYIEDEQDKRDIAAVKADIAQLKAEQANSRADQKAKLQFKIDILNKKLNHKLEKAKQRSKQRGEEAKAKWEALEKKATKANSETKAKIEFRIAEIKEEHRKEDEAFDKWYKENE